MSSPSSPLSVRGAAEYLGLEPVVLRALIHAGRVPAFRDNQGRWRVKIDQDVETAVAEATAADRTPSPAALSEEIGELTEALRDRETLVDTLQTLLQRQDTLVEGFEAVARSALAERDDSRKEVEALDANLQRSLSLLAEAVERGETLTERQVALEAKLSRSVALLERSVDGQERMFGAAGKAAAGFEKSLDLLENRGHGGGSGDANATVEQLERQLNRALALLDNAVGGGGAAKATADDTAGSPGRQGLFARLRKQLGGRA